MSPFSFGTMQKGDTLRCIKGVCEKGPDIQLGRNSFCFFHMLEADVGIN